MSKLSSKTHDHFFKNIMKDNRVAKEFFQTHLPIDLQKFIRWDSLKLEANDHINRFGAESLTDVVFSVLLDNSLTYLTLMVDHQSTPHPLMLFRTENYRYAIINNYIKQHPKTKTVPLVIPIVLYHGLLPWNYEKEDLCKFVEAPKSLVEKYAFKPFIFVDLNAVEDVHITRFLYAGVMQLTLKRIFAKNILFYLPGIMQIISALDQKNDWEIIESVLKYLISASEVAPRDLFNIIQTELPPETGDKIMTTAEQLIATGKQQGMQQVAKNLFSNGLDIDFVAKNTGLDFVVLQELQKEMMH